MNKEMDIKDMAPVKTSERHIILDALRGFALLGICLANFPEFSLYTFQKPEIVAYMPTAGIDKIVRFLQYLFVDGKFYTIFSLLFGIGFSIIIDPRSPKGSRRVPYLLSANDCVGSNRFPAPDVYLEW